MLDNPTKYLPGDNARARWLRMDAAAILKRFFFVERSLILNQAAWLPATAPFEVKTTLPRYIWESALTAQALRERVFELRYPSRLMEIGEDAPLIELIDASLHAPNPAAFLMSLAYVLKPALLEAYRAYLESADEIADGPSRRFLRAAVLDLESQIENLQGFTQRILILEPQDHDSATAWTSGIVGALERAGGLGLDQPVSTGARPDLPGWRRFEYADTPARDRQFRLCRFYWPDIIDPTFPYGQGLLLQLRSAVSHFNEVWAVETGGLILSCFAETLGWAFIFDAARWTYDESRHCRMGYERLRQWGFEPHEIPLGSYIYESARGQDPIYRLGMLFYFETKNISKKRQRADAFARYQDRASQHDMDFDWADETIHAHYGSHWLGRLNEIRPNQIPPIEQIRDQCDRLVAATVGLATDQERAEITTIARTMLEKAARIANSRD